MMEIYLMFTYSVTLKEDLSKVGHNQVVQERSEEVVYKVLVCGKRIVESKRHE